MLLATKYSLPPDPDLVVPRQRLCEQLDQALQSRLTLVVAPAGYGKTTLVRHWISQSVPTNLPTAWFSLDEYDDEPVRFMRYFVAVLQQISPEIGVETQALLQSNPITQLPEPSEVIMTMLINDIVANIPSNQKLLLVIDDFHNIGQSVIIDGIRFWIEHVPANVHTVIMSRDASMFPVARWQVRRRITTIFAGDLSFTQDESITFVRETLRLDLDDDEIKRLVERTEGWIAGLQLAALSLQSSDDPRHLIERFTGSDRHVMDYLIGEVLYKQSDEMRMFLLQTSILGRLSPDLCDAITRGSNSYELLLNMEKRNLFLVPLDNQRSWYRYHPLFAESMRTRLSQENIDLAALHLRACQWFSAHDLPEEAIQHAIQGGHYPEAADTLDLIREDLLWQESRWRTFMNWCQALPLEEVIKRPHLAVAYGWSLLFCGEQKLMGDLIDGVKDALGGYDLDPSEIDQIVKELSVLEAEVAVNLGKIGYVMDILERAITGATIKNPSTRVIAQQLYGYAYRLDGNVEAAKRELQNAISLSDELGQRRLWLYAHGDLAETYAMTGELNAAYAAFDRIFKRFPEEKNHSGGLLTFAFMSLSRVQYQSNRLEEAAENLRRSREGVEPSGWIYQFGLMIEAEIEQLKGNWERISEIIDQLRVLSPSRQSKRQNALVNAFCAKQFLLHGQPDEVERWVDSYQTLADVIPRYQLHRMDVTRGRYLLALNPSEGIDLLTTLQQTATVEGWGESQIEIDIMLALAYLDCGESQSAFAAIERALRTAMPDGVIASFLVEGAAMVPLLKEFPASSELRPFVGLLQAAFLPTHRPVPAGSPLLVDPLTKRELDVLKMMAKGLSNPEIADSLILATGTVAKHSNNIFGKLGVRNRTEATQKARQLGLV